MRDLLEAARRVEARGEFVGERLIVDKAVGARRADGLFVKTLGVELAAFDARDLGADQCGAVLEIFGAILRPDLELPVMGRPAASRYRARSSRDAESHNAASCKRAVEVIFRHFKKRLSPVRQRSRLRCRCDGGRVVPA